MAADASGMPDDFDPYHFVREIGSGGMGSVYLVEDTRSGGRAVMKVGRPDLDDSAKQRFRTEGADMRRLKHRNIPALHGFGTMPDGRPFLATEWVDGVDLAVLLQSRTPLSVLDALALARAVAGALACAHRQGVLHLDVKPANILVTGAAGRYRFQEAKLLDFGVVERLQADTGRTIPGRIVGTPYYMSPEQVTGEALSPAADVFSLGVVMYEMLGGRRPFEAETPQEMFFALLSKEPEPLGPPIPPGVASLIQSCLAKSPADRPLSGAELETAIDHLLRSPLPRAAAVAAMPPQALPASRPITQTGFEPASAAQSRRPTVWIAAAAAAAAGLAVCAIYFTPSKKPSNEVWLIPLGALMVFGGVAMGRVARRYIAAKRHHLSGEISAMLKSRRTRKALSMTLSLQVDEVVAKCRLMDEKFLGLTMALMVKEYDSARKFDDRQKALMNAIAILEKLGPKLSPWYVRHEKLVATGVSLVGVVSGLATAAQSVAKLVKGTP
jgi:hypothetical protein